MTSCGESSDGLAPKKPITSRHPPSRTLRPHPRGLCRHVHPLTTSPLQDPTFVTRIPGRRWRLVGHRLCRPLRRGLPGSSGSPSGPGAPSASRRPGTARRLERHATPGPSRRPTEVTARRGTSRPSVNRPASSVHRCLPAQLWNRTLSRGPPADTRPATRRDNHRAAHMPIGSGPTNWFRSAASRRVADGVLRCSRPHSDW